MFRTLVIGSWVWLACASTSRAQCLNFISPRITASDGALQAQLGFSIALSADGSLLLIGANNDSAPTQTSGSAYVYSLNGSTWVFQQKLTHPTGVQNTNLGNAVAITPTGDTLLVGAPLSRGSVFAFRLQSGTWVSQQEVLPANLTGVARFGSAVGLARTGDRMIVGSPLDTISGSSVGSAYVFRFVPGTPGSWVEEARLLDPAGSATNSSIASKVALSPAGDIAVISATGYDFGAFTNQGSALVFRRSGIAWTLEQRLTAPAPATNMAVGQSVALSNDRVVIGTNEAPGGTALVFRYVPGAPGSWVFEQRLVASDTLASDGFGQATYISAGGERVMISATSGDGATANTGSVYLFSREDITWTQKLEINPPGGASNEKFGFSIAVSGGGGRLAVGSMSANAANLSSGAAYTYDITPPGEARAPLASVEIEGQQHAAFSVIASGVSPISYRWRHTGVPLIDGPSPGGGTIVGSATNAMLITAPGAADAGLYDCVINDSCAYSVSSAAMLTISTPPATTCPGDADGNGLVNFADITSVLANFNAVCP
ncbi:MAG: hypothetical protein JNK58_08665 [Phycisphaerae bacterium]|nr:hypothetical protein [Phycisphaerae bacterium]